ncbi:hypothetical protein LCM23_19970 [Cytobacillus kochii]|uniref:hypothetical protein n=1 Tax=Cytobacillus kochii TaxID=859143 RepID=UPI001CD7D0E5|nr:hypothetical protein [Cytobacillus kochii]MCA1028345.1 hypothetical protein [Cytobacillus kochii]
MTFIGLTIQEWAATLAVVGTLFGGISYIFKTIIIKPLSDAIANLQKSIDEFREQMKESDDDRKAIHMRINRLDKRVHGLEIQLKGGERHD